KGRGAGYSRSAQGYFGMEEFVLDAVDRPAPEKIAFFGIERVRPESERLAIEAARREAEEKGIATLPVPQPGNPYPFAPPPADGGRIRSADLRGKAVAIAVWGPGGVSSIALMMLKQLRKDYDPGEVAFVDISFDGSPDDARADLARHE